GAPPILGAPEPGASKPGGNKPAEKEPAPDWFVGRWFVEFRAAVEPLENARKAGQEDPRKADNPDQRAPLIGNDGTTFSESKLRFDGKAWFDVARDGKVEFHERVAFFRHQARWKTTAGLEADYRFDAAGKLHGTGRFEDGVLKLRLDWTSGEGHG